jgi:hypothetical protein
MISLACICGGWIEIILISGGMISLAIWRFLKRICFASGCDCECHEQTEVNQNTH